MGMLSLRVTPSAQGIDEPQRRATESDPQGDVLRQQPAPWSTTRSSQAAAADTERARLPTKCRDRKGLHRSAGELAEQQQPAIAGPLEVVDRTASAHNRKRRGAVRVADHDGGSANAGGRAFPRNVCDAASIGGECRYVGVAGIGELDCLQALAVGHAGCHRDSGVSPKSGGARPPPMPHPIDGSERVRHAGRLERGAAPAQSPGRTKNDSAGAFSARGLPRRRSLPGPRCARHAAAWAAPRAASPRWTVPSVR